MRVLVTGGTGVLGRSTVPVLVDAGHDVVAPGHTELDLFDARDVAAALDGVDAVFHLATRIPESSGGHDPDAWAENDRLRRDATRVLVDGSIASQVAALVVPTVTFVYPRSGPVDEDSPLPPPHATARSALDAESEVARFAAAGRRGVVLRLGLLDGPGTRHDTPVARFGATLHVEEAGRALAAALGVPSGTYNVCRDDERVSNTRFRSTSGWRPGR